MTSDAAAPAVPVQASAMRPDQVEEVVALRALLLADLGLHVEDPAWRGTCRQALLDGAADARLTVQVAERDGQVVACAVALLQPRLPTPGTVDGTYGWLEQVATATQDRGHGHARVCVEAALGWLRDRGVREVQMQATEAGEPLYRALGFVDDPQARLLLRLEH